MSRAGTAVWNVNNTTVHRYDLRSVPRNIPERAKTRPEQLLATDSDSRLARGTAAPPPGLPVGPPLLTGQRARRNGDDLRTGHREPREALVDRRAGAKGAGSRPAPPTAPRYLRSDPAQIGFLSDPRDLGG
ncbi:MAG: hypothetical protein DLM61_18325, partial [Pseudonocardiales bacterium]